MANKPILQNTDKREGVISYNGYTLFPDRSYTFNIEPVYDRAERTLVGLRYLLKGKFVAFSSDLVNYNSSTITQGVARSSSAMETVRAKLTAPGKRLTITGIGFGDLDVGPGGKLNDIDFGPKPKVLACDPVACLMGWEVEWVCEFQVAFDHGNSAYKTGKFPTRVLAFNFNCEQDVDHRGLSVRTISGYWQIWQTPDAKDGTDKAEGRFISPSSLKNQLKIAIPKGFRRKRQKYADNEAKTVCTFSIVDEELSGRAFPQGIVEANVDYELESETLSFAKWRATLSGTLTSKPGAPRTLATQKFMEIVRSKVGQLRQAFKAAGASKKGTGRGGVVIPEKFKIRGGMFSRDYSFSFSFRAVGCLEDIIVASGMYSALPDSNWEKWAGSMTEIWQPGGVSELQTPVDVIFETGDDLSKNPITATAKGYTDTAGSFSGAFAVGEVTENESWLEFENYVRAVSSSVFEVQKLAQEVKQIPNGFGSAYGALFSFLANANKAGAEFVPQDTAPRPDVMKYKAKTTQYVIQYGKALRVAHQVNIPQLGNVGGAKPVCVDQEIESSFQVGTMGSDKVPVYAARWAILYYCPEGFSTNYLTAAENPVHCPIPTQLVAERK